MARPTTPMLDEAKIISAVRKLSAHGDFTLAQLASALGVRVSSIYHHVPSKAAIVQLLRREWIQRLREELGDLQGIPRLIYIVRSYAQFALEIPALVPLLITEPLQAPELRWLYEDLAATLTSIGVNGTRVLSIISAIDGLAMGAALDTLAPPFERDELPQETYPMLHAAVTASELEASSQPHIMRVIDDAVLGLVNHGLHQEHPQRRG